MVEISKRCKIVLLINSVAALIFMVFYLIIPKLYFNITDGPVFDPYYWRAFGVTLLILGLFSLRAYMIGNKEQAKFMLEIGIIWPLIILILNIWELIFLELSLTYTINTWLNNVILLALGIMNIYTYYKE